MESSERDWNTAEVFASGEARDAYILDLENLWRWRIVEANVNFHLAMAVREAPLEFLLGHSPHRSLLDRCGENALHLAALDTINALMDETNGALTVEFLQERLVNLARPKVREALREHLQAEFAARDFAHLRSRALRLRHKLLAHADAAHLRNPEFRASARLTLEEIGELLEHAKGLISVLSLEVGRAFEFPPTIRPFGMPELIVGVVREHSWVLRKPEEEHPLALQYFWKECTPEEQRVFNEWRVRVGRKPWVP